MVRIQEPQTVLSTDDLLEKFLSISAFDSTYDFHSPRNYENFPDFKIVAQKNVTIPADSLENVVGTKTITMGGRLNFHQRTKENPGPHTVYDTNELAMIIVADRGTVLGEAPTPTGVGMKGTLYFYDN